MTDVRQRKPAKPIGQAAARGFSWLLAQTVATKIISMGSQLLLAWLLLRDDFGLIGLAYTVTAFVSVFQQAGLKEILVHRHDQFHRWATPVFWMSACLGLAGAAATLLSLPIVVWLYSEPRLAGLLAVLSLIAPLSAMGVVPQAMLTNGFRFKALSFVAIISTFTGVLLSCGLAWLGWGAYAIVLGLVLSATVRLGLLWWLAPFKPRAAIQLRRWRYLIGDSSLILITGVLLVCVYQGDYISLGIFHDTDTTGLYYFAFTFSLQTIVLFTSNLSSVLFPALAQMKHEPERQMTAFFRACRLLALLCIPFCFTQAFLADPLVRLLFPEKWYGAIPFLQILGVGMAFRAVGGPGGSMMQSQGRFRSVFKLTLAYSTVFMVSVFMAAYFGGAIFVAVTASIVFTLIGPINLYVAALPLQKNWRAIGSVYSVPVISTLLALSAGALVSTIVPASTENDLVYIGTILLVGCPVYGWLVRVMAPSDCRDLQNRIAGVLRSRQRG